MKSVHLVHVIPDKKLHIFHGYDEIIETVRWGLEQSGYKGDYALLDR